MSKPVAKLTFWGVRGSIPTPDRDTWRHGGNTPCLDFEAPDGLRIILDCGTGVRVLGKHWVEKYAGQALEASVLVTHYHWDHIQGIPFFLPLYFEQNKFHFYSFQSPALGPHSLRQVVEAQLTKPYFPVDTSVMKSARTFKEIKGGDSFQIGETRISTRWLNHPQGCLGYRLDTAAGSVAYATDNEPGVKDLDKNLRELVAGADIFIQDAQYSPEQLATTRKGWGHSTWLEGVKVAREMGAKNLVLFHHDPESSDRTVDGYLQSAREEFHASWAATEGMRFTLGEAKPEVSLRNARVGQRRPAQFEVVVRGKAEDGEEFEERATLRDLTLQGAFLSMRHRPRLQSEIQVVIEAKAEEENLSFLNLSGTVVHNEPSPDNDQVAVGVVFFEDTDSSRVKH